MGGVRVSQRLLVDRVLTNLNAQTRRIQILQEQLSTQLRVNRPSDDPLAARRGINARDDIAKNNQFLENITAINVTVQETETAIYTSNSLVQRVKELVLQSSNSTNSQSQLDQFAIEINQILENLVQQSNHVTNGRYIFGGTNTQNAPFVATRDANNDIVSVTYEGNDSKITAEVSDGVFVSTNETGQDVFLSNSPTTVDIIGLLVGIRDNLRTGNTGALQGQITQLDQARDQLLVALSRVGATQNRINNIQVNIEDLEVQLQGVLSEAIDADYADVIVNLNAESNAYQAALNAGARVIQPSLLDFVQ